ncbi:hypothetical protein [Paludisphaera rhizosphaerae]|uniref:hypothetical protein n=1 Tax=Paludisphaera rhizosphaerae TaxID=2711216 RepID=UPI0013EDED28|nr:hypothetical protein [Paludisphaera rhizosphaerae]
MIGLAFIACALTLLGVNRLAESRERDLRMQVAESRSRKLALEGMTSLLSDRGIDILMQAPDAELLKVCQGRSEDGTALNLVTPTGVMLGEAVSRRMTCVLLDYRNYRSINADDLPEPGFGLRLRSGFGTVDVLMDASEGSSHQNVWINRTRDGELMHASGWRCMNDPELQKLVESILSR